ncbi:MAG: hypothetical protein WC765_01605 [Phycisphaerae bacterium]|jgi:hypothetical protein
MKTRYQPVDQGYEIMGSRELFNRTLYGSHAHDDRPERYFTFAGDLPLVMGAATDWSKNKSGNYAKSGVLFSGLALTPGITTPAFYSGDVDVSSHWFHNSEDIIAVFRNGWMEYEFRQFSPWFPDVRVNMAVFPLMPEDGFLVHYRITTDQRILFCAGFGGMTDYISRLEYPLIKARQFRAADCKNNTVTCGRNRALLKGPGGNAMWIGTSFPMEVQLGDALSLQDDAPAMFLQNQPVGTSPRVVKMFAPIGPGETLDGFLVVIRNEEESILDKWLNRKQPVEDLKRQIRRKQSAVSVRTPDAMLDLTVPPTVLAMDASWHKNTFYHGAHAYHTPFLGWRNWYGPTVIGWHDRVETAIKSHFAEIVKDAPGEEAVWYDGQDRPDLDHEGSQYHQIRNSTGYIPCFLGGHDIYNMQEVAMDMLLHHLEWSGDLELTGVLFEDIKGILDWEERILDPDSDGLYQNFLNTWISDGHSYNGGGCAQASAYNYRANLLMAKIADKMGRPSWQFQQRAAKIWNAIQDNLWIPEKGVIAEYIDTVGNKLVHPSPELSTAYLSIECGVADMFQAYQMLRFTETELRNETTLARQGRLVYSSNWYPKKYSTCGIFAAENIHLALSYYQSGLADKGWSLLTAIVDSYFLGKNPGLSSHVLTAHGISDGGDLDFSDVSSMYLRLIVEGLFGIRFRLLDDLIEIAPNFPSDWTQASLQLKDLSLNYSREGRQETLVINCATKASKTIKLPLRSAQIVEVQLNGTPVPYQTHAAVNHCFLMVETSETGCFQFQIIHGDQPVPALSYPPCVVECGDLLIEVRNGTATEVQDASGALRNISMSATEVSAEVRAAPGNYTDFVRVKNGSFDAWLAADFGVEQKSGSPRRQTAGENTAPMFEPLEISRHFNSSLKEIHALEYRIPRPKGYSIGSRLNGRYAWDWNHGGHNAVRVDDAALRQAKEVFRSPSGIGFRTPASGQNVACVSLWDNFPSVIQIPLSGRAEELALFFIGVTNPMQSRVENARFTVTYRDQSKQTVSLVNPENFDDWLNAALQNQNETVYFSVFNHGMVQRIPLEPSKELASLFIEAIANEVIVGLLGISVRTT